MSKVNSSRVAIALLLSMVGMANAKFTGIVIGTVGLGYKLTCAIPKLLLQDSDVLHTTAQFYQQYRLRGPHSMDLDSLARTPEVVKALKLLETQYTALSNPDATDEARVVAREGIRILEENILRANQISPEILSVLPDIMSNLPGMNIIENFCNINAFSLLDLSLICVYNINDWLGIGGIVSVGCKLTEEAQCEQPITVRESLGVKFGFSLKFFRILLNAGLQFKCMDARIGEGNALGSNQYNRVGFKCMDARRGEGNALCLTNQYNQVDMNDKGCSAGNFMQIMYLAPLPNEDWKLVLYGECNIGVTELQLSNAWGSTLDMTNVQVSCQVGIGVAYRIFDRRI